MSTIGVSGDVRRQSGIGVVQTHLYPRLESRGFSLIRGESREYSGGSFRRIGGLFRGLRPLRGDFSAYLSVTPPAPVGLRGPLVSMVHDLRWMRTRSGIGKFYRYADLWHTVERSERILCVSERTRDDLVKVFPMASGKALVTLLGPGIVPDRSFVSQCNGRVLLIGGAKHKRNEVAAHALALVNPDWCSGVCGVNLTNEARRVLDQRFGLDANEWRRDPTDEELVSLYRSCEYFMFLGIEEGFGLPYVEALASGCKVIAIDQPLTRELLGRSALLIPDGTIRDIGSALVSIPDVDECTRREWASRYSWDLFADRVAEAMLWL